jgi:hypothetical protein
MTSLNNETQFLLFAFDARASLFIACGEQKKRQWLAKRWALQV